ncbi:MAG: type II toxin-antitoxin system RelE/ParE family toxin [Cyclobacteriaceae bacterium]
MEVSFLKKFSKDLDKISNPNDLKAIADVIDLVKKANRIMDIPGTKKLVGFADAYRIRHGDYRIGIFVNKNAVIFARVAHRKDIYKIFP